MSPRSRLTSAVAALVVVPAKAGIQARGRSGVRRCPGALGPGLRRDDEHGGRTTLTDLAAVLLSLVLGLGAGSAAATTISEPVAVLQGLDKITARVSTFDAPVGTPVRFGTLSILVRDCEKTPPEETPQSGAFLQIDEAQPGEGDVRLFSGWMFASSPALSALEHPVYDVELLDCKAARASPPGSSAGNTAR
jgi:hypothetical protein